MEKFRGCNVNRCTANAGENAEVINAHSDVIEALAETTSLASEVATAHTDEIEALRADVARLTPIWEQLRTPVFTFAGVKCEAPARMTADEAADIILAEQAKLTRALNDPKLRVWTRAVTALMVGALREHGREDR